jgi:hypothetical protein
VALTLTDTVLGSARVVRDLALSEPVRERWTEESACAGMVIGGLAHHLAGQAGALVRLLPGDPDDPEPIPVREHYQRAAWANSGTDDEANVSIREGADEQARSGYDALAERLDGDLAALPAALGQASDDRPVLVPWQGWSLTAHDLAVTRLMEMVVHADDLAASIDVPTPRFPDEAVRVVLDLLAQVAVDRHGQGAVVRALSRPQRAPASVSAF